jgi:UDP-N-acetylglucosamine 2-epimerase (non-hydrolysing)
VVVVGDVNSTIACALVAVKLGIPVAHVEAGLRSFDRTMPEEINRVLTDHLSDLLFVTEESGTQNLLREGIAKAKIHFVGNVMIDSLRKQIEGLQGNGALERFGVEPGCYGLVTLHRPSNVDAPEVFRGILSALASIAQRLPLLFPVHPRTRARIRDWGLEEHFAHPGGEPDRDPKARGLHATAPLGYKDFLDLMRKARIVLTDSGGIQEETTALSVPCLTLRHNTERPSTIIAGTNRLVGTDPAKIVAEAQKVLDADMPRGSLPPLWDGKAATRIAGVLMKAERGK